MNSKNNICLFFQLKPKNLQLSRILNDQAHKNKNKDFLNLLNYLRQNQSLIPQELYHKESKGTLNLMNKNQLRHYSKKIKNFQSRLRLFIFAQFDLGQQNYLIKLKTLMSAIENFSNMVQSICKAPCVIKQRYNNVDGNAKCWDWLKVMVPIIFLGVTPLLSIGSFISDLMYIFYDTYYLRETLTLGLFLLAFFLIPIIMLLYWIPPIFLRIFPQILSGVIIFFSIPAYLVQKLTQDGPALCNNCLCSIPLRIIYGLLYLASGIVSFFVSLGLAFVVLGFMISLTFLSLDSWLFDVMSQQSKNVKSHSKVMISYRSNFEFVKDLLCLYVQVVVAGYMLKLTPIAIIQFIFRGLLILKALVTIIMNIYEHEEDMLRASLNQQQLEIKNKDKDELANKNSQLSKTCEKYSKDIQALEKTVKQLKAKVQSFSNANTTLQNSQVVSPTSPNNP